MSTIGGFKIRLLSENLVSIDTQQGEKKALTYVHNHPVMLLPTAKSSGQTDAQNMEGLFSD